MKDEVVRQLVEIHGLQNWTEADWDLFYDLIAKGWTIASAVDEVKYDNAE